MLIDGVSGRLRGLLGSKLAGRDFARPPSPSELEFAILDAGRLLGEWVPSA
jgi:hypothetical protein